jgi:hypothetical protein
MTHTPPEDHLLFEIGGRFACILLVMAATFVLTSIIRALLSLQ